jgi:hypothetical protein
MEHELKTIQPYFGDINKGLKTFEVRKNDRNFQLDDTLWLREYDSEFGYSGSDVRAKVTYILADKQFVKDGYVILGIDVFSRGWYRENATLLKE